MKLFTPLRKARHALGAVVEPGERGFDGVRCIVGEGKRDGAGLLADLYHCRYHRRKKVRPFFKNFVKLAAALDGLNRIQNRMPEMNVAESGRRDFQTF